LENQTEHVGKGVAEKKKGQRKSRNELNCFYRGRKKGEKGRRGIGGGKKK